LLTGEDPVELVIGTNHVRAQVGSIRFTSKLIDGRFPEYGRVIPSSPTRKVGADRETLRAALQRAAILSNEKYRGIRLSLKAGVLMLQSHNPEQEEAEEELDVTYDGEEMEIGFNVNYLLDALAALDGSIIEIGLTDSNNSCLMTSSSMPEAKYVVMPMRL
jgi:DNA polymerase III subunit beta